MFEVKKSVTLKALNKYNKYNLIFHPLEAAGDDREPKLQAGENYAYLFNLIANIFKSWFLKNHFLLSIFINFPIMSHKCVCGYVTVT